MVLNDNCLAQSPLEGKGLFVKVFQTSTLNQYVAFVINWISNVKDGNFTEYTDLLQSKALLNMSDSIFREFLFYLKI